MDPDPMEFVEDGDEGNDESGENESKPDDPAKKSKFTLNALVAVSVALLATFLGICQVKSGNIVQAMQQAQVEKLDNYAWYQARNIREEIARATVAQLTAQLAAAPPNAQPAIKEQIDIYKKIAAEQEEKKQVQLADAEKADKTYNDLNIHDDQFDLSDAMLALAISLLALTALTQRRWLFGLAMVPTVFGLYMGLAGLLGWSTRIEAFSKLLS